MAAGTLAGLVARVLRVKGSWAEVRLALFAREGFTAGCRQAADDLAAAGSIEGLPLAGIALFTLEEMGQRWEDASA